MIKVNFGTKDGSHLNYLIVFDDEGRMVEIPVIGMVSSETMKNMARTINDAIIHFQRTYP